MASTMNTISDGTTSIDNERVIPFKCTDDQLFLVPVSIAKMFRSYQDTIEQQIQAEDDDSEMEPIEISEVTGAALQKVIDFCNHYQTEKMHDIVVPSNIRTFQLNDHVQEWYANYMDEIDNEMLWEIAVAGCVLDISPLENLLNAKVATIMSGKSHNEIIATFGMENVIIGQHPRMDDDDNDLPLAKLLCHHVVSELLMFDIFESNSYESQVPVALPDHETPPTCCICFECVADKDQLQSLPCSHSFHKACIYKWFSRSPNASCPTCRDAQSRHSRMN